LAEHYGVFPSGSALGFGVGPLLLASKKGQIPSNPREITLCPGQHTTATLLFKLFYPHTTTIEQVVFSEIMPRLKVSQADFGVCIHEGRFTWQNEGLDLVEDLGTRWERETSCPLPLGGIIGRLSLGDETLAKVQSVICNSLEYALANPSHPLPTMRRYAQEFDDSILMQHVELYVNDWTRDLGEIGRQSLNKLSELAAQIGLTPKPATLQIING
jgi:1,4-dihydroxy-6-naphthoate synthase